MKCEIEDKIFCVNEEGFEALAIEIFQFQYAHNPVYRAYADVLGKTPAVVRSLHEIPFLPIRFFKTHAVKTGMFEPEAIFESSGTTQTTNSRHWVKSLALYKESFCRAFELFYGDIRNWCVLGLLPSYLERQHSSLVVMVNELIRQSAHPESGFYLYDHQKLSNTLQELEQRAVPTLLIGVTFGLLDFAETHSLPLKHTIVMETGGMKGRRKEMVREEVHEILTSAFQVPVIHSEYGMSELLSQAYSKGKGVFSTPPWMKVLIREMDDPLTVHYTGNGLINVIDLANLYSCAFIATDDVGKLWENGSFEVNGRADHSDLRGCSLLAV